MNKDNMGKLIERGAVLKRLSEGNMTQRTASLQLSLSHRQIRRLLKRYKQGGCEALIHGNFGKQNSRKLSDEVELKSIEWLHKHGADFGSTFAAEKVAEYLNIYVSVSTMRTWRKKHGLCVQRKKSVKQFTRRPRKEYFGVMLQIDGSFHDWFEGRGLPCVLLTVIDDATGKIHARFAPGESTKELMILMRDYVEKYGRPHSVYSDHGGPYKVNISNPEGYKKTQFGRALKDLGIELIFANSPQAKGRIERNHGIHQDRLIKEMRLKKISSIETANQYLQELYLLQFNQRFAIDPAKTEDVHRSIKKFNLNNIFCFEEKRTVQNDGTIQFQKQLFQITKNRIYAQPKSEITVRIHFDDTITLWAGTIALGHELIQKRPAIEYKPIPKSVNAASRAWNENKYVPYKLKYNYTDKNQNSGRVG